MPDVQKLVPRNPNVIEFNLMTGSTAPTTWLHIVPRDNVSVTDNTGMQTYSDFGTAMGAIAAMAPDGDRTVSISFSAYMIPGDAAFEAAFDAYENRKLVAFRENGKGRDGVETFVQTYTGFIAPFNRTYNKDGVAEVNITFNASAKLPVTP